MNLWDLFFNGVLPIFLMVIVAMLLIVLLLACISVAWDSVKEARARRHIQRRLHDRHRA